MNSYIFTNSFPEIDRRLAMLIFGVGLLLEITLFYTVLVKNEALITLAVLVALVGAALIFRFPQVGFLAAVAMKYSAISALFFGGLFKLVVFYTLFALFVSFYLNKERLTPDRANTVIVLLSFLVLVSMTFVKRTDLALEALYDYIKAVVLFSLAANILRSQNILRATFWIIIVTAGYVGLYNIYQGIQDPITFIYRIRGVFGDPNHLALVMVSAVPIAYSLARSEDRLLLKGAALILGLVAMGTAIATLSRGGMLALASVLTFIIFKERKNKIVLWSALGLLIIAIAIISFKFGFGIEVLKHRLSTIDESAMQRYRLLKGGIAMFMDHPFLGVGLGNFIVYSTQYTKLAFALYPHNMFIHIAAELGVVAFFSFAWLIFHSIRQTQMIENLAIKQKNRTLRFQAAGVQLSLLAFTISGLFLSQQFNIILWMLMGMRVALGHLVARTNQAQTDLLIHNG